MSKTIVILAALFLSASSVRVANAASEELSVALSMEARVRGVEITLGEIARVTGLDPEEVRRLEALSLGSAPAPGYSRVFRSDRVAAAIRKALPELGVRLTGERACRVFPEVEEISAERLVELARTRLTTEFAMADVEFELIGEVRSVQVPAGTEELSLRVRPGNLPATSGTKSVPLEILVDGLRYRTIWTAWKVARWETREVLASPVRAGELLRPAHFERRRVQVAVDGTQNLNASLLEGAVALRDMRTGEAVGEQDVRRPMVVALGETLFLEVRRGAIEARVPAVALGSGAVGDRIRVRTTGSGQELLATVRSRDLCRIDLGSR